jgi:hypothetical protein
VLESSEREREREREMGGMVEEVEIKRLSSLGSAPSSTTMPLLSLNHVSFVCKSVRKSVRFYEDVLGFVLIKRPSSFDFEGAWYICPVLFPYSHLLFLLLISLLSFLLSFSGFNSLLSQKLLGVFMRTTLWPYRLVR